jgi:hypothetical protein
MDAMPCYVYVCVYLLHNVDLSCALHVKDMLGNGMVSLEEERSGRVWVYFVRWRVQCGMKLEYGVRK